MTDIVEALRKKWWRWNDYAGQCVELSAADEIERLRSIVGWLVIRRVDGTVVFNNDATALDHVARILKEIELP